MASEASPEPSTDATVSSDASRSQPSQQSQGAPSRDADLQGDTSEATASDEAGRQGDLAIDKAPSPQALLGEWYQRYDKTFFKGHTRPLKVGIHEDLAASEPWPEKLVRRALACYVNLPRYLKSVREGAERIDLQGALVGAVDAQAAEHAKRKLDRLQAEQQGRGKVSQRRSGQGRRRAGAGKGNQPQGASKADPQPHREVESEQSSRTAMSQGRPPHLHQPQNESRHQPHGHDSEESRLQRKLDALMARHNGSH
ncbi:MAG: ABC transporter substrate-binding protein [Gammaproteobacteria bacterium]|nr:ABC transporter substrate-binding protein [Gammaproteobacteria bacterium]